MSGFSWSKQINILNEKFYVGLSKFEPEENPNYLGSGYIFLRALKKYGKKSFKKEILEKCKTKEELMDRERYWIKLFIQNIYLF